MVPSSMTRRPLNGFWLMVEASRRQNHYVVVNHRYKTAYRQTRYAVMTLGSSQRTTGSSRSHPAPSRNVGNFTSRDGSATVARPGVVTSPRWLWAASSMSTRAVLSLTYLRTTLPVHQVVSPTMLKRRISVRTRFRKPASPIQLVTREHIQAERWGP